MLQHAASADMSSRDTIAVGIGLRYITVGRFMVLLSGGAKAADSFGVGRLFTLSSFDRLNVHLPSGLDFYLLPV